MNKTELSAVVLLFALLIGWGFIQKAIAPPPPPPSPATEALVAPGAATGTVAQAQAAVTTPVAAATPTNVPVAAAAAVAPVVPVLPVVEHDAEEQTFLLTNALARVEVSSWGGAITRVSLMAFEETQDEASGPVVLDFADQPSLALTGLPGLSTGHDFEIRYGSEPRSLEISRDLPSGLRFTRTLALGEDYLLNIEDVLDNTSEVVQALTPYHVTVGPMRTVASSNKGGRYAYLGLDTLPAHGGGKVEHWGRKKLPKLFGGSSVGCSKQSAELLPLQVEHAITEPLTWMASKNKFFVHVLNVVDGEATGGTITASRDAESSSLLVSKVRGSLEIPAAALNPGEQVTRRMTLFVGPKKHAVLKTLGSHQADVMEFGWFHWMCKPLLWTLNAINGVVRNYGIAIMLLTALVRIIFWPVTHKATESMRRMQKIQPLVTEIREKHKSNPQKMNQEVMALYKEHKANPMGGCLPMVIQIPVFIALFTVLRSAVELRYAPFLWISDLSEPENLFAGMIPVVGSLNILPLFMTATMVWQQRLTPSGGDPQQQKMMMMMPIVMLFIFYSMPSALVLYWSTSQCLAIVQLLHQRKKNAAEEAAADDGTPEVLSPALQKSTRKKRK